VGERYLCAVLPKAEKRLDTYEYLKDNAASLSNRCSSKCARCL
jgi:hypothetical protein